MVSLSVVPVTWAGAPVTGPSVSVFHCQTGDENALIGALHTFFTSIQSHFPNSLSWTFPTAGDVLDEASGSLLTAWSATPVTPVTGTAPGQWVQGVGARIKWPTIGVVGGRRVVGSTFLVPLIDGSYTGAGNLDDSMVASFNLAAVALGTTPNGLRIYSKKNAHHDGISFPTLTGQCPDAVSWLRRRRT